MRKGKRYQRGYEDGWFRAVDAFTTAGVTYDDGWNAAVEAFRKAGVFVPGLSLTLSCPKK